MATAWRLSRAFQKVVCFGIGIQYMVQFLPWPGFTNPGDVQVGMIPLTVIPSDHWGNFVSCCCDPIFCWFWFQTGEHSCLEIKQIFY